MGEATFSFQVDEELRSEFAAAAAAQQRAGEDLLRDYMREVVQERQDAAEYDAWFRREVQKGIDEAKAGKLIPSEEVEAEFAILRAEIRDRMNNQR